MNFATTWHDSVESTNTALRLQAERDPRLPCGTVLAARAQTAGRGRFERIWQSYPGRDLTFSWWWRGVVEPVWMPALTMACSLAVVEAIAGFGVAARCKWPNDVLVNKRKICGILAESVPCPGYEYGAVVGIGINVNMTTEEASAIDRPATSLCIETEQRHEVDTVLQAVLRFLPEYVERWERSGFEGLRPAWERRVTGLGLPAVVDLGSSRKEGVMVGFGSSGAMHLRQPDGHDEIVLWGDVLG